MENKEPIFIHFGVNNNRETIFGDKEKILEMVTLWFSIIINIFIITNEFENMFVRKFAKKKNNSLYGKIFILKGALGFME